MLYRRLIATAVLVVIPVSCRAQVVPGTYANPVRIQIPGGGLVENCADPSIIRGQTSDDPSWYVYCTSDPLNDADRDATGALRLHFMTIHRSADLVNWTYVGDVFTQRPSWVAADSGLWA